MISDKSYSNIPLYFCLFCSILNMAQYVWIQCASTSCRIHIFVSSIVLKILFCHPKELNLLLNLYQSFLGAGNLSDRLESKKSFAFGYWEKVAYYWCIFQLSQEKTLRSKHTLRSFSKKQSAWYANTNTSQIQKWEVMPPALKSFLWRKTVGSKKEPTYGRCDQQRSECCQLNHPK